MLPALGGDLSVSFQARSKASNVASVEFGRLGQLGPLLLFLAFTDSDPVFSPLSSFQISKTWLCLSAKYTIKIGCSAPTRHKQLNLETVSHLFCKNGAFAHPLLLNNNNTVPWGSCVGFFKALSHLLLPLISQQCCLVILLGGRSPKWISQNKMPFVRSNTFGKHWDEQS